MFYFTVATLKNTLINRNFNQMSKIDLKNLQHEDLPLLLQCPCDEFDFDRRQEPSYYGSHVASEELLVCTQ